MNTSWLLAEVEYHKGFVEYVAVDNRDAAKLMYLPDKVQDIAAKCFLILMGLPLYSAVIAAAHAVRCVTLVSANLLKRDLPEAWFSLAQEVCFLVKTPLYVLAVECAALCGLVFPLPMRPVIATLEREWSGVERKDDVRKLVKTDQQRPWWTDRSAKMHGFLAFCFQPIGSLSDGSRIDRYRFVSDL